MNTSNVVREVFRDVESGLFDKATGLLTDNFKSTVLGQEVNRTTYISVYRALLQGVPDMKFQLTDIKGSGDKCTAKVLISGTNDRPIPALMNGWKTIPATHKKLQGVIADLEFTIDGEKIRQIKSRDQNAGMFTQLFDSLGVDYHHLQKN